MSPNEPLIRWSWVPAHLPDIAQRFQEHVTLTLIALGVGFAISLLFALLIRRYHGLYAPITWLAGALYAIPSLALFAFLVPITGLSVLTAEIGLVSYTLLILTRALVGGLRAVPADVLETADGLGLTPAQRLWWVELPLAIPIVIGGLRVAAVTTIGLVTVTALIGQGGFGAFIMEGIQRFFSTPLIVGALLSVLLAVLADSGLVLLGRLLTPWSR